jgi:cation diffusion facilitator CzcD-associated flavoprotein CzcO
LIDAVVIGAGPYGLSVAAHLRGLGTPFRIFGKPMVMWREHMPKGMVLKSEPFASNLSAPGDAFSLKRFCDETGRTYKAVGM